MDRVIIFDTTLRDGEQSPGCRMDVPSKLLVARQLQKLGVGVIEAGFAISSPGDHEAITKIAQEVREPIVCSLARTRQEDIEAAAKALEKAAKPRIHVFVATSDVHMEKKLRKTPAQILEMVTANVKLAKKYFDDVEFSPEDAARTGIDFLEQVVSVAIDSGATTINVPDTVGYAVGNEYPTIISVVSDAIPKDKRGSIIISTHCHNDLGMAVANTLAGVQAGARQVECCVLGIGERAGNAQLEAVVMGLLTRSDRFNIQLGINTSQLYGTSRLVASVIGKQIPDNLPVVGGNAFSHGAGIHQDGMRKDRGTYEIMKPEDVGWQGEANPLTKHSGRAALESRVSAIGYTVTPKTMEILWPKFKALADQKTYVYNDDLHLLMQECFVEQMSSDQLIKCERVDYHRVGDALSANVILSRGGETFEASGTGDGPVASIGSAIMRALKRLSPNDSIVWEGYNASQSTGGVESIGVVNIRARYKGKVGYGRGSDTDTIVAAAKAMVSAINHLIQTPAQEITNNGA